MECFFLFPWVRWFCSRILKSWSDFLAVEILSYFNVQQRGEYHDALGISERGKTVILKRKPNEMWVNNYNPHFIKAWQANMDIQFCMDSYAIITYITDYLTKGDAGLTKGNQKL